MVGGGLIHKESSTPTSASTTTTGARLRSPDHRDHRYGEQLHLLGKHSRLLRRGDLHRYWGPLEPYQGLILLMPSSRSFLWRLLRIHRRFIAVLLGV